MGKTPAAKRLVIVALSPVDKWPELAELAAKGHEVLASMDERAPEPDLILGPNCWRMAEPLRKYLPNAVKAAQAAKAAK